MNDETSLIVSKKNNTMLGKRGGNDSDYVKRGKENNY